MGFDRAERDAGAGGDLGVREVLEEGELDDSALGLVEEVQLVEQQHPVGDRGVDAGGHRRRAGTASSAIAASASRRCRSRRAQVSAILCRQTPTSQAGSGPLSGR